MNFTTKSALMDFSHSTSVAKIVSRGTTAVSWYWKNQYNKRLTWSRKILTWTLQSNKQQNTFSKDARRSTVNASAWTAPQSKSTYVTDSWPHFTTNIDSWGTSEVEDIHQEHCGRANKPSAGKGEETVFQLWKHNLVHQWPHEHHAQQEWDAEQPINDKKQIHSTDKNGVNPITFPLQGTGGHIKSRGGLQPPTTTTKQLFLKLL